MQYMILAQVESLSSVVGLTPCKLTLKILAAAINGDTYTVNLLHKDKSNSPSTIKICFDDDSIRHSVTTKDNLEFNSECGRYKVVDIKWYC